MRLKDIVSEQWSDGRAILAGTVVVLRRRWLTIVLGFVVACVGASVIRMVDQTSYEAIRAHKFSHEQTMWFAKSLRRWGAFIDTASLWLLLVALGSVAGSRRARVAGLSCLLAAVLAGAGANVVRWTVGRPRPGLRKELHLEDRFYGWPEALKSDYQSFPSGHTAASAGNTAGLFCVFPAAGAVGAVSSAAVIWASIYNGNHYLSDVWMGLWFSCLFGVPVGVSARRRLRSVPR